MRGRHILKHRIRHWLRIVLERTQTLDFARRCRKCLRRQLLEFSSGDALKGGRDYQSRIAAEISQFEHDEEVHNLPPIFHYWSNKYLLPKIRAFGFINSDDFFVKHLTAVMQGEAEKFFHFISIGAGNCDTEIRIAQQLQNLGFKNFQIDCLDLNSAMLKRGRDLATQADCTALINPIQGDFNCWVPKGSYHAVIANQSLHHVMNLEILFDAIHAAINPVNGVLIASDMIGRNGHQRWPEALAIVQEYWSELPSSHKFNHQLRRTDNAFVNWDCATDGFEGIRAQDILRLLIQRFHFELFVPFSNVIAPFIDRAYGPNFSIDQAKDCQMIDAIHARDEAEMMAGNIKPTQMFAVLSTSKAKSTRQIGELSPQACIRES